MIFRRVLFIQMLLGLPIRFFVLRNMSCLNEIKKVDIHSVTLKYLDLDLGCTNLQNLVQFTLHSKNVCVFPVYSSIEKHRHLKKKKDSPCTRTGVHSM